MDESEVPIPWGHYRQVNDDGTWVDVPMDPVSAVLTSGFVLKKGRYPWGSGSRNKKGPQ